MLPARKYTRQTWLPDIFQDFFENNALEKVAAPAMNVIETDCCYKLELAAPGMTKDDFKVHINSDGNLVIDMERNKEEKKSAKESANTFEKSSLTPNTIRFLHSLKMR